MWSSFLKCIFCGLFEPLIDDDDSDELGLTDVILPTANFGLDEYSDDICSSFDEQDIAGVMKIPNYIESDTEHN